MKSLRIEIYSIAFVLVWSSGYVFGALATQVIAPFAITMWRFLVAAIVLAAIAVARREQWPRGRELAADRLLVAAPGGLDQLGRALGAPHAAALGRDRVGRRRRGDDARRPGGPARPFGLVTCSVVRSLQTQAE